MKQSKEWEELFQTVINKAKDCPAMALCFNNLITAEQVWNAAGNHVFDDHFEFWGITERQGHQLRGVFQIFSIRDEDFQRYIQGLIDNSSELKYVKSRV
jgi:hypothetical protein